MRVSCIAGCMSNSNPRRRMKAERSHPDELILGLVSISDRASQGVYADQGLPGLKAWFERALTSPWQAHERLIPDERAAHRAGR